MSCPRILPRGSSAARTHYPWITSQTLYHWAKCPRENSLENCIFIFPYAAIIILTLILPVRAMALFCGECRPRSDCTYVQSDLALHSPQIYHYVRTQTNPGFDMSAVQVFWKHSGKRRNCSYRAISPFPVVCFFLHVWRTFCHFHVIRHWCR